MRAAWYERNGPAEEVIQVGDMPTPEPGPGEVRVKVAWSGLNPTDLKRRSGFRGQQMGFPRIVPHQDGSGIIDKVGAGVSPARVGEPVWIYLAQAGRPFGTAAEYVTLPQRYAVRMPAGAPLVGGACIGVPVRTAHRALFADGPVTGKTVLVQGGAGAVGNYAIQLAKWGGASKVLTTVSSPAKAELAAKAGADVIIDYRKEDVAARVMAETGGGGVDHIVEVAFGKNMPVTLAVLRPFGIIAAYASDEDPEPSLPYYPLMAKNAVIRLVFLYVTPDDYEARMAQEIADWLVAGKAYHATAKVFPLDQVAAAHAYLESGAAVGNVMIEVAGG